MTVTDVLVVAKPSAFHSLDYKKMLGSMPQRVSHSERREESYPFRKTCIAR